MQSCIYRGTVHHRRQQPRAHEFKYPLYMLLLDLAELDEVFRGRLAWSSRWPSLNWYRRKDHMGPHDQPLDTVVREFVETQTGIRPIGPIRLLTQVRQFGFLMNPVAFYFLYSADSEELQFVVAEVNNTPWNEQHLYLLTAEMWNSKDAERPLTDKRFHVSPFMPMDQQYRWQVEGPADQLSIRMEVRDPENWFFHVRLMMNRMPLTGGNLLRMMCRFPWMTLSVFTRIYWQAFLLWRKKIPFYPHPKKQKESPSS